MLCAETSNMVGSEVNINTDTGPVCDSDSLLCKFPVYTIINSLAH
jgi:hypothetical protein